MADIRLNAMRRKGKTNSARTCWYGHIIHTLGNNVYHMAFLVMGFGKRHTLVRKPSAQYVVTYIRVFIDKVH